MIHEISHKGTRNPLIITDKGKFKWQGEFEALKRFVEEVLEINGKWTAPGGVSKQLRSEDILIRWYENQTITLSGPSAEKYKRS